MGSPVSSTKTSTKTATKRTGRVLEITTVTTIITTIVDEPELELEEYAAASVPTLSTEPEVPQPENRKRKGDGKSPSNDQVGQLHYDMTPEAKAAYREKVNILLTSFLCAKFTRYNSI